MSKEELQEKINVIRDATEEYSITNEQVAEVLTTLNENKLETDLSNLTEEHLENLKELLQNSTASGDNFE